MLTLPPVAVIGTEMAMLFVRPVMRHHKLHYTPRSWAWTLTGGCGYFETLKASVVEVPITRTRLGAKLMRLLLPPELREV